MILKSMKGALLTLKTMGSSTTFREFLRRVAGINYHYHNIPVDSNEMFRFLRKLVLHGYHVYGSDDEIVVRAPFGEVGVNIADRDLLYVMLEPLEKMYGFVNIEGAVVIDIGAYIGETALLFLSKGASRVYALEPVMRHYRYLLRNIFRNNVSDRIVPLNYGVWLRDTFMSVRYELGRTGLHASQDEHEVIRVNHLGALLREIYHKEGVIDLVKMDCEGCEYSLLCIPNKDVRLVKEYIIEIHGSETPIIGKMSECGYAHKFIMKIHDLVNVYHFLRLD